MLAFLTKRARARGAFFGLILGVASVWVASIFTNIEFLWFNVVGCFATFGFGYLISLTVKEDKK